MDPRVADLVRRAYGGEVLGAELFEHLAEAEADPDRRERLIAAQLLEEQTREAAACLARDLGVGVASSEEDREAGRRAAGVLSALDWPERMNTVGAATGNYRDLYEELASVVPDPEHPYVVALVRHEQALNAFAMTEADGGDGLGILRDALDEPYRARLAGPHR
jgi:hypothetical protein